MKDHKAFKDDKYLGGFIRDNKLSDEQIAADFSLFSKILAERKACAGCKGLEECSQPLKGKRPALTYDGVLFSEYEYCDYGLLIQKRAQLKEDYVYCGISPQLLDIDLNNIEYTPAQKDLYLKLVAILHRRSSKGLYICGDLGTGKTYLCTALANSLVKDGRKVAFVKVSDFFNEMRSYYNSYEDLIGRNVAKLKKAEYLFLDDIGAESVSPFVRDDILFRILDHRLENGLMTIFTSNLNKSDLLEHYQYDRRDNENPMNAKRLLERIDILADTFVLAGDNMRRK